MFNDIQIVNYNQRYLKLYAFHAIFNEFEFRINQRRISK